MYVIYRLTHAELTHWLVELCRVHLLLYRINQNHLAETLKDTNNFQIGGKHISSGFILLKSLF